jgi:hypothetical protein
MFIAVVLVAVALPILRDVTSGNEYRVERELASPDRTHRAVVYTGMGGGAAGWCAQRIAIVPAKSSSDPQEANDSMAYVFSVSCSSKIALEWIADDRLRITYSVGEGVSVTQSPRSKEGAVAVDYQILQ